MYDYLLKAREWQYIYSYLQKIPRIRKEDESALRDFVEGFFCPKIWLSVAFITKILWKMANGL